jgi:V/A-type H+-transporting ATPase subunit I
VSLKPQPTRWFELLVPRESLSAALTALSRTHAVQLQARSDTAPTTQLPAELAHGLAQFRELDRRFGEWWPEGRIENTASAAMEPNQRLQHALRQIQDWIERAEPRVATVESIQTERGRLAQLLRYFELAGADVPRPDLLAGAGPRMQARLFLQHRIEGPLVLPDGVIAQRIPDGDEAAYLLVVGESRAVDEVQRSLPASHTDVIPLPSRLPPSADAARREVQSRLEVLARQLVPLRAELAALARSTALEQALGDIAFIEWFATHVPQLKLSGRFAWVTGWFLPSRTASVETALQRAGVPHLTRYPSAPAGLEPPVTLQNPRWVRPFEFFVGLMGTPAREEADPTLVLALVAPLLFGFMFGDIGQGALLMALGLVLRRRFPALALLVPGGFASLAFGVLFGSVFAREDLIGALWLRPLDAPLVVLGAALAIGVGVIMIGLAADAFGHFSSGLAGRWLRHRGGIVMIYLGAVLAPWRPVAGGALAVAGAAAYFINAIAEAPAGGRLAATGRGAAELAETSLQLAVNTVSFLRVGAFALAHCGLSVAIVGLAEATQSRFVSALILIIGNVFVLALEALIVGIQTTRLVLFEFFIRFLRGTGRAFQPLPDAPLATVPGHGGHP